MNLYFWPSEKFKSKPLLSRLPMVLAVISVSLTISWSTTALSLEGFHSDISTLPPAVKTAWNSTFLLIFKDAFSYVWGTAFLVKKEVVGNSTHLYFLTNNHLIQAICEDHKGPCPALSLARDARITAEDDFHFIVGSKTGELGEVEVVNSATNPDLALLRVMVKSAEVVGLSPLSTNCTTLDAGQPLYAVGFSNSSMRTASGHLPIAEQNTIFKRWSSGIFITDVGLDTRDSNKPMNLICTTVDALGGSSGSPVLNTQGALVGVMKSAAGSARDGFAYKGNENFETAAAQSYAVGCREISEFIGQAPSPK